MPVPRFTQTPLERRMLAGACEASAAKERGARCRMPGSAQRPRDFIIRAEGYEQLAAKCMGMARP